MMTEDRKAGSEERMAEERPRPTEMDDSWLLDLIDDPKTELALSQLVVEEAVEDGMSRQEAERVFLPRPPAPRVELQDLYRMMSDILAGATKPHIETEAGWKAWRELERDIAEIKRRGGVVEFPAL